MNEAAARSDQSVPKTHVPVRTTRREMRKIKSSRTIIDRETLKILNFPVAVSQTLLLHSHLLSVERPAVAMREEEPTKTKS